MRIWRFWARHDEADARWPASCWGWSQTSADEARSSAAERARALVRRLRGGAVPPRYPYGTLPLREEIIEEVGGDGEPAAVITRNAYGALVLNTAKVLFADVDLPEPKAGIGGVLGRLFGKRDTAPDPAAGIVDRIRGVADDQRLGLRLYRTCAGFRCLVTSGLYDPTAPATIELLERCGSDPLYVRLCKAQECFRARLTPKPWRCGVPVPPSRYPFETEREKANYRTWEDRYHERTLDRATCAFVESMGPGEVHPAAAPIVELHDRWTVGEGALA